MNIIQFAESIKLPSPYGREHHYIVTDNNSSVLHNLEQGQREYVTGDRQSGCTTTLIVSILYHVLTNDNYNVGFISTNHNCIDLNRNLMVAMCGKDKITHNNKYYLEFFNGSKVFFKSYRHFDHFRGITLRQLVIDNYDYITPPDRGQMLACMIPCLASTDGKVVLATTPFNDVSSPKHFNLNVLTSPLLPQRIPNVSG